MDVAIFMTKDPLTVTKQSSIYHARKMMEEHNIRRLPVLDGDRLVGIVSKSDIMEAGPPDSSNYSIHELNNFFSQIPVSEIMTKHPLTVTPDTPIEVAAKLMRKYKIASLPVMDCGKVVGMITESDLFDAFIEIMGGHIRGSRLILDLEDKPGMLANVTHIISMHGANILSVVTNRRAYQDGKSIILIKIDQEDASGIVEDLADIGIQATFRFEEPV
jgi:acetoin utilization protein AcuB